MKKPSPDLPDDDEVGLDPLPEGVVVSVGGELDVANAGYLRQRLIEAIQDNPSHVCVDLRAVSFIDSTVVGLLVSLKRRIDDYGGRFSVRSSPHGRMSLARRGLLGYLDVDPAG
jgi:anti-anti-sigma factor